MSGAVIPALESAITDEMLDFAVALVDRSGVSVSLEEQLCRRTGRRRQIPVRALLGGLVLLALSDRPLHLTLLTDLLFRQLNGDQKRRVGVEGDATGRRAFLARYRSVRYLFHLVVSRVDPSPYPKNRRLPSEVLEASRRAMTPEEVGERTARLETLVNALLQASVDVLAEEEVRSFDGSVGLDATPVALYSRGPSRRSGLGASDPDGSWYVREGDHRGEEDAKGRVRGKVAWALEATIATMATPPGAPAAHPSLAIGFCLGKAGADPGGTGARVMASVSSRGHQPGFLGADRAYSSALPERFHLPVRALHYEPVFDYRVDELGVQANSSGAILLEGTWCCPATPRPLIDATAECRAGTIDEATYARRIVARSDWRLKKKAGPDRDGYERWSCPAIGERPGLMCPHRPASLLAHDGRMKVSEPPEMAPKLCRQGAITIAPDVGARHRQRLAFGTEEWSRRYATCRNTIEGWNGYLKDPSHEALAAPARRRVRGIAAQSLFCALLLMAANIRKIRAHRELVAEGRTAATTERARRRRTSLADYAGAG